MPYTSNSFVRHDGTVVIAFPRNLRCHYFQAECQRLEEDLRRGVVKNVVIDCSHTTCFGCTALGLIVRLWKTTNSYGGRFSMCCLSELHQEMLSVMRLNGLWPIYASRAEALEEVRSDATSRLSLGARQ